MMGFDGWLVSGKTVRGDLLSLLLKSNKWSSNKYRLLDKSIVNNTK